MPFPLEDKLVIAVSSSALFDLGEADRIFKSQGSDEYRKYTIANEDSPFEKGPAFSFIQRLLQVNNPKDDFEPIEVVLISKNDADTGHRVHKSLRHYQLDITRSAFTCGRKPYPYISVFKASLFLSTNEADVMDALENQKPGGMILFPKNKKDVENLESSELRIAFDFDGILADDSSENIYQTHGLEGFQKHEEKYSEEPLPPGPLQPLLAKISAIQKRELERQEKDSSYKPKIRTSLITSRSSTAQERVVKTLRHWGITCNEAFFLGGASKDRILSVFRPHIFFDDQKKHLSHPDISMAMVHVPYGKLNK